MKYDILFLEQFNCGIYDSIEDFVRQYYYTEEDHEDWITGCMEDCEGTFNPCEHDYNDIVNFYIDTIKAERFSGTNGFSWEGYSFQEVDDES